MLDRWAREMRASNRSARTIAERVRLVQRVAEQSGCDPHLLDADDLAEFLAACKGPSRATYFNHLHAWFTWLARHGIRDDLPTLRLDRPKVGRREPRTITTGQVRALAASSIRGRTRTMVLLGAYQGMRASEIATIRGVDLDPTAHELTVTGKGGVTRVLPLHPQVELEAEQYGPRWWFPSHRRPGEPIHAATVSNTISDAMERVGVPGTCHDLRRWYATTMVEAGVGLTTVQRLLGHSSVATTQRYVAVGRQTRIDAVLGLPDLLAPPAA